jgi:hypothetical protein
MRQAASAFTAAALGLAALCLFNPAHAQASGALGSRTVQYYWIEGGSFLALKPTTPWDNPTGCTQSGFAVIPATHPMYRQALAAVVHAMSTNSPIYLWAQGCHSAWGETWPSFYGIGVGER